MLHVCAQLTKRKMKRRLEERKRATEREGEYTRIGLAAARRELGAWGEGGMDIERLP